LTAAYARFESRIALTTLRFHERLRRRVRDMESGEITRSAFLRVCAGAGIGLAGLGLSRPRRAAAAPPTIEDIRATAGPSSAIEPSSDQTNFFGM
jgi:hypothetical protein